MDVIETIKANVSPVVLSVINESNYYDVDERDEEDYQYSDEDNLIEEDERQMC